MSFVIRLTRNDLLKFYRSLYNEKIIFISKPFVDNEKGIIVARLGIKLGYKKFIPFREVRFTDFYVQERAFNNINSDVITKEILNKEWHQFMYDKFGEEYVRAIK